MQISSNSSDEQARRFGLLFGVALLLCLPRCAFVPIPDGVHRFLVRAVHARNERRYERAKREVEARGYEFEQPPERALLHDRLRERCLNRLEDRARSDGSPRVAIAIAKPDEDGTLTSDLSGGAGDIDVRAGTKTGEVRASIGDACRFFAGRAGTIEVERPGGAGAYLVPFGSETLLARDPGGNWVRVVPEYRAIDRRIVRVIRTCNRMPRPTEHPLRRPNARIKRVVLADAPLRSVSMEVGREVIDVKCTRTTH